MKKGLKFSALFAAIIAIQTFALISADFSVSPSSFPATLGQNSAFNITITNPATDNNITQIDITLPSSLKFLSGTNSTNALGDFSNTSSVLTWVNLTDYLVGNATGVNSNSFSFIANATTIGTFNISVNATNSSGSFQKNIPLNISAPADSTAPVVTLVSPANNAEDSDGTLVFQCNVTDNVQLSVIELHIWDSNNSEVYMNEINISGTSNQSSWDRTFNANGAYKWNCFANDSSGNLDWATNRTLTISISTPCTTNWTYTNWSACSDGLQTRTVTDRNNCNVTTGKPDTNKTCTVECTPRWSCAGWQPVECPQNETQTTTCIDSENCNVTTGKPPETRTCEYKASSTGWMVLGAIAVLLVGGIIAAGVFFFKSKSETDALYPPQNPGAGNPGNYQTYQSNNPSGYNYEHS